MLIIVSPVVYINSGVEQNLPLSFLSHYPQQYPSNLSSGAKTPVYSKSGQPANTMLYITIASKIRIQQRNEITILD